MSGDTSITTLFQDAHDEGFISPDSLQLLVPLDLNGQMQQAMGIPAGEITAAEVVLVVLELDDSISMAPLADEARTAQHQLIDAMEGSKQGDGILMATWTFDDLPVHPWQALANVERLNDRNYVPNRGYTPLYDGAVRVLGAVVAKTQEFTAQGQACRSITVIVSDGDNNRSRHSAADVAKLVRDLERTEMHIVFYVAIEDGVTDFKAVGKAMGIDPNRIKTIKDSEHEFRQAMLLVSQSAVRASQTVGTISQVGFAAV